MSDKLEFATKLAAEMKRHGWSQSELARRASMRRDAISTYVNGKAIPNRESLEMIAKALGVPFETFSKLKVFNQPVATRRPYIKRLASPPVSLPIQIEQEADGSIFLRISRSVSLDQATKILGILRDN